MRRAISVLAAAVLLAAAGCQRYRGQTAPVVLESDPSGATAYVVPLEKWIDLGEARALGRPDRLASHRIASQRTPLTLQLPMHRYVFVAERDGLRSFATFTPGRDETVRVELAAGAPADAAAPVDAEPEG